MNQQDVPRRVWQEAAGFAARAHEGQKRKDGETPYVAHPFRVALTVRQVFECADRITIAAALLHDTIEDTDTDYEDIAERFGHEVAEIVVALTKDMRLPEAEREARYDEQLAEAGWRASVVKLADVFDNLSDAGTRADSPDYAKLVDRCERALAIARQHQNAREAVARGIMEVERLVEEIKREHAR